MSASDMTRIAEEKELAFVEVARRQLVPMPGTVAFLTRAAALNVPVCLVTNAPRSDTCSLLPSCLMRLSQLHG